MGWFFSRHSCVGFIHSFFLLSINVPLCIGLLGATAVLLYAAPHSPLAQVRNTVGGHLISAFVGVTVYIVASNHPTVAKGLAVSCAIFAMLNHRHVASSLNKTTALMLSIGNSKIHALGYLYAICPLASGVFLMLFMDFLLDKTIKMQEIRSS